jgi:diadenosine tetraphosphatase ApaH/serine/threonine PP2A family protein phosphatase
VNVGTDDHFEIPEFPRGTEDIRTARQTAAKEQAENTRRARTDLHPSPDESHEEWLDRATATLHDHDYGFCVHHGEFGTRSSSLITLRSDGTVDDRFADGAPCETDVKYIQVDVTL